MQRNIVELNVDSETWKKLVSIILGILPSLSESDLNQSLHLKELGADSVDRVEIIMTIINQFNLKIPLTTFSEVPNIGALAELIDQMNGA